MNKRVKGIIGLSCTLAVLGGGLAFLKLTDPDKKGENTESSESSAAEVNGADIELINKDSNSINRIDITNNEGNINVIRTKEANGDGTFKISWDGIRDGLVEVEETPGEIEGKFVCAEDSGIILLVDGKTYYYTCNEEDYFGNIFASIDFENLQDDEITQIVTTQVNIKNDLIDAFDKAGIAATIDERTGEVVADDSILFGVDEAIVSDEGKAYLDSFIEVYSNVIMPYVDQGYIAEITVEGHTDTSGTYDHNLDLSQNRAKAVADYCIEQQSAVKDLISAKGFAFDYPIFDGAGKVDMKASRRVVFSFKMGTGK